MDIVNSLDMFQGIISDLVKDKIGSELSDRDLKIDKVESALNKSREEVKSLNRAMAKMEREHIEDVNKLLKEQEELIEKVDPSMLENLVSAARKEGTNSGLDLAYFMSDLSMGRSLTTKKVKQIVAIRSKLWFKMIRSTKDEPLILFADDICTDNLTFDTITKNYNIEISKKHRGK